MANALVVSAGVLAGGVGGGYAAFAAERSLGTSAVTRFGLPSIGVLLGIVLAVRVVPGLLAVASLVLLAAALPLSVIDATTRKLPDRLLLPAIPACASFLVLAAVRTGHYGPLWRALAAASLVFFAFTALAIVVPGQMGFGDCKAAALCALPLGYLGWRHVLLGVLAAYLLAALYILGRGLFKRTGDNMLPFGPFLFAGALAVLLLA